MSAIHSQASNFADFIKTGVDARTGQFTLAIAVPLPPANQLCGPALTLTLAFSTLSSMTNRGYGLGWSLGLSELDLNQDNPRLSLSSGEQYAVDLDTSPLSPGRALRLLDQKLPTFSVTCQANGDMQIDQKNGASEILRPAHSTSARYLLAQMRSPEGRCLYFDWAPFGESHFVLTQVRDEQRTLLTLTTNDGEVQFTLLPHTEHQASLQLLLSNDRLTSLYLPCLTQPFAIEYDARPLASGAQLLLPAGLTGPLGASEIIHWSDDDDGHLLPAGAPFASLPRVIAWTHSNGQQHSELNHSYRWIGEHNFLGYGSDQAFEWNRGRDNLYQVNADYRYEAIESLSDGAGKALGTIHRTWNRFHLLIHESRRSGDCEVCHETTYGIDPNLSWEEQPAWCQLPHEVATTYIDHAQANASRRESTLYRYDAFGNILHTRFPSGVEEFSEYYPAEGEPGCPADPLGRVRHLKKKVVKPAPSPGNAPTLSTTYTYQALPSLIEGAAAHLVVASEQGLAEAGQQLLEQTQQYHDSAGQAHHGRVIQSTTTLNTRTTTTLQHYRIEQGELITETTKIGFEDDAENRSTSSTAQSLLTGLTTWTCSDSGAITRHAYDALGRVVQTLSADASPYRTQRLARYHLDDATAREARPQGVLNPVMVEQVEATGRRIRQWLDGEGRRVCVETEDLDNAPGTFKVTARSAFDALGRQVSHTEIDWLGPDVEPLNLTTHTDYDDWGHAARTTNPQGVHSHSVYDPVQQRLERWQSAEGEHGPKQVVLHNAAGSPIETQDFDSSGALQRTTRQLRDGLDRVIEKRLCVAGAQDVVTSYAYDHYSRLIAKTLADGTRLHWTFAAHSDDQHPESLAITPAKASA